MAFYRENFGEPTRYIVESMQRLLAEGLDPEQLIGALQQAARAAAQSPWAYAEAVLRRAGRGGERAYGGAKRPDLLLDFPDRMPEFSPRRRDRGPPGQRSPADPKKAGLRGEKVDTKEVR